MPLFLLVCTHISDAFTKENGKEDISYLINRKHVKVYCNPCKQLSTHKEISILWKYGKIKYDNIIELKDLVLI